MSRGLVVATVGRKFWFGRDPRLRLPWGSSWWSCRSAEPCTGKHRFRKWRLTKCNGEGAAAPTPAPTPAPTLVPGSSACADHQLATASLTPSERHARRLVAFVAALTGPASLARTTSQLAIARLAPSRRHAGRLWRLLVSS